VRDPGRGTRRRAEGAGYSLVEVLVALVVLQVGLLGAAGLVVTASRQVATTVRLELALTLAEAVADSLLSRGWGGDGSRVDGPFVIEWSGSDGWAVVAVRPPDGAPLVRIPVPVVEP
jgi:type II secretory pathway pseudopilin PulG